MTAAGDLVAQAQRLAASGKIDEAKSAYLAALRIEPANPDAMTGLGSLLATVGMYAEARVVLEQTLLLHPNHADAHRALVIVFSAIGDKAAANEHSRSEYALRPIYVIPYTGEGEPVRLLLVAAGLGINTRTARFRDPRLIETTTIAAEFVNDDTPLPTHDVIFNAIGEADRSPESIDAAERLVSRSNRRILNHPAIVRTTGRVETASRFAHIPGVVTAKTRRVSREHAADPALAAELGLPFLLRSPGHHTGAHFERIDDAAQTVAAIERLPGDQLLAMAFLDSRDAQGRYRKYRMMIVDGALYPLHAAIGKEWMLHFFSGTHGDAERELDAAFLADPSAIIGAQAMQALHAIARELRLDYGGIDFAIDSAGNVLLFEANATMVVPESDPDPRFAYRTPYLDAVAEAATRMILTSGNQTRD
jgi:tetratricopeptide (TPR) repeat protein